MASAAQSASTYVESALEEAGGSGRFQYFYLAMLGMCWFYSPHVIFRGMFTGLPAEVCPHLGAGVDFQQGCVAASELDCSASFDGWNFANGEETWVAEFGLVCEQAALVPLQQTIFFLGVMIGSCIWGYIADTYGRRVAFFVPLVVQQLCMFGQVFAQSYTQMAIARAGEGFGYAGFVVVSYLWNSEVLGTELRSFQAASAAVLFSIGQASLSLMAYLLPQWRQLTLVESILGCFFILYMACLRESPKWLAAQGRLAEAHAVLCACAKANGRPRPSSPPAVSGAPASLLVVEPGPPSAAVVSKASALLDERLLVRFLVMWFAWFGVSVAFYGLSLDVVNLPLNVYWANAIGALTCIPPYIVSRPLMEWHRCGRRGAVSLGYLAGSAALLLSIAGGELQMIILYFVAQSAISVAHTVLYVWACELFPTDIRGTSMGILDIGQRVGSMAAPLLISLGDKAHPALPIIAFAAPCVVAGLLTHSCLPETLGRTPPGTVADLCKEQVPAFSCCKPRQQHAPAWLTERLLGEP